MRQAIKTVPIGSKVRVVGTDLEATLVRLSPGRAHVKLAGERRTVVIPPDPSLGKAGRTFEASATHHEDWSPGTRVEVVE